jgi:hypothetical protein
MTYCPHCGKCPTCGQVAASLQGITWGGPMYQYTGGSATYTGGITQPTATAGSPVKPFVYPDYDDMYNRPA